MPRPRCESIRDGRVTVKSATHDIGTGTYSTLAQIAAVANAVYHATGIRVRDLPITLAKILT